jgi:hypothetical protein
MAKVTKFGFPMFQSLTETDAGRPAGLVRRVMIGRVMIGRVSDAG